MTKMKKHAIMIINGKYRIVEYEQMYELISSFLQNDEMTAYIHRIYPDYPSKEIIAEIEKLFEKEEKLR